MKISFCTPSYRRPNGVDTLRYLPYVKVFVDEGEFKAYRRSHPKSNIVACPKGVQGSVCRVRNYILDREFENGADVVVLVDDDLKGVYYWEQRGKQLVTAEMLPVAVKKYSIQAREIGAYFWGFNLNQDKQVYREYTPFSTTSPVLGPFQAFLRGGTPRYDERFILKEDYDMSLQNLHKYRVIFRVNKYFYACKQAEQPGGCAAQRNMEKEKEQLFLLQKKWGSNIVRIDATNRSHNLKRSKKNYFDFNPIIKVPIKGV